MMESELMRDASSDEFSMDGMNPKPIANDYMEAQNCKLIDYLRKSISEQNSENAVDPSS